MNVLFTICGRSGSKGFRNKNIKKMNGVPLVYYTLSVIKLYQDAHPEDSVIVAVNTDSKELLATIHNQKAILNIQEVERKEMLAGDSVAKVDVIKDTYLKCKEDRDLDIIVDLDITSPVRRLKDVEKAIRVLLANRDYDLVFSVIPARRSPYFNMVEKRGELYKKICPSDYVTRQQVPKTYELNASIYVYRPDFLDSAINKTILDYNCGIVEMKDYRVLDIDSEEDFILMSILMKYFEKDDMELNQLITIAKKLS